MSRKQTQRLSSVPHRIVERQHERQIKEEAMEQTLPYIKLHHEDDVVIARNQLAADTVLEALGSLRVLVDIPAAHKLAIRPLKSGQPIRRYGQIIGFASADIAAGEHVHTHNTSMGSFERDYAFGQDARPV